MGPILFTSQNDGPFWGYWCEAAPDISGTQKGTIILRTDHLPGCRGGSRGSHLGIFAGLQGMLHTVASELSPHVLLFQVPCFCEARGELGLPARHQHRAVRAA